MLTSYCRAAVLVILLSSFGCGGGGGGEIGLLPVTIAGKTIGGAKNDFAWAVSQTSGNGYIIAGTTNSKGAGGYDAYLIKTDATGSVTQEKTFGTANNDFCFSIQSTTDGGYVATGFNSFNLFADPLNGELPRDYPGELFLVKMDADLTTAWTMTVSGTANTGNPSYAYASGYIVQQTSDSGYIVAGAIGNAMGGGAGFLLKTNQTGSIQWTASFGDNTAAATGVVEASGGGYVASVTGVSSPGHLVKVDSSGAVLWDTPLSGTAEAVGKTSDGEYVVTGTITTSDYTGDVYLARVSSLGTVRWEKHFGSAGGDTGYSVQETADYGFIIAGRGSGGGYNHHFDAYVVKTDCDGNFLWQKYFGGLGDDYGRSVRATGDGGYIVGGFTNSKGAGGYDIYLIKTDGNGKAGW